MTHVKHLAQFLVVFACVAAFGWHFQPEAHAGELLYRSTFNQDTRWHVPNDGRCAHQRGGHLHLCLDYADGRLVQGRVDTKDRWSFTYGKVKARIKFLGPRGAHGAGWITTTEDYIPGQAEIDYAERVRPGVVWHAVHWRPPYLGYEEFLSDRHRHVLGSVGEWHTYTVNWRPDRYVFRVDGQVTAVSRQGLSDRPKMLVFSLLSSKHERHLLQWHNLDAYATVVDWVEVRRNRWSR